MKNDTSSVLVNAETMLYYISNADLPGQEAHTIQQVRMCEAFERAGADVCLVHPSYGPLRKKVNWDDIAPYYGLETEYTIRTISSIQTRIKSVPQIGLISMAGSITGWLLKQVVTGRITESDIIYGRNYYGMIIFNEMRKFIPRQHRPTLVFEIHEPISAHFKPRFFQSIDGLVCITQALKDYVLDHYDIPDSQAMVAPDGVNPSPYSDLSQGSAREQLELPNEESIIMYTGHCYEGKGVETLVRAAKNIDGMVYIVGGYKSDIERIKREVGHPENVVYTGFVDPAEIPTYQSAADILIAPYDGEHWDYVSPLKLFEYMAAGRPIVASNLEILREVLTDGQNAALFPPRDSRALAEQINTVLGDRDRYSLLAEGSANDAPKFTWKQRARNILSFIQKFDE